jgi:zinc transporter ZupT
MPSTILLESILAFVSALAGAYFIFKIRLNHERLCFLISLSAGALAGAALLTMLPEAYFESQVGIPAIVLSLLTGYFLFWVINKYYFHVCPACAASHFDEATTKKFSEIVLLLFTALSLHAFLDGVAIATAGKAAESGSIFTAIFAHKFPEGVALASLIAGANYKKNKIFQFVFLVESTTIIGALFGEYFLKTRVSPYWMGLLQAHLAGSFMYLSIHAVIGEIFKHHKKIVFTAFGLGLAAILALKLLN